jgi:hypothetical protein
MLKSLLISNKSKSILLKQLQVDIGFSKLEFSEMPTLLRENTAMFPLGPTAVFTSAIVPGVTKAGFRPNRALF